VALAALARREMQSHSAGRLYRSANVLRYPFPQVKCKRGRQKTAAVDGERRSLATLVAPRGSRLTKALSPPTHTTTAAECHACWWCRRKPSGCRRRTARLAGEADGTWPVPTSRESGTYDDGVRVVVSAWTRRPRWRGPPLGHRRLRRRGPPCPARPCSRLPVLSIAPATPTSCGSCQPSAAPSAPCVPARRVPRAPARRPRPRARLGRVA
jgi:hypothetical protein